MFVIKWRGAKCSTALITLHVIAYSHPSEANPFEENIPQMEASQTVEICPLTAIKQDKILNGAGHYKRVSACLYTVSFPTGTSTVGQHNWAA